MGRGDECEESVSLYEEMCCLVGGSIRLQKTTKRVDTRSDDGEQLYFVIVLASLHHCIDVSPNLCIAAIICMVVVSS